MSKFDKEDGFECDYCGETVGGNPLDFHDSVTEKKAQGWLSRKVNGEWYDFCCADCYKQFLEGEEQEDGTK